MLSGTRAGIAVKVFGDDRFELRRIADEVRQVMAIVPGVVDLALEVQPDIPMVTAHLNRAAIGRHGMQIADVAEAMETTFAGVPVARVRERQAFFPLVVRFDPNAARELADVRGAMVQAPTGARLPLAALADIHEDRGPSMITREHVQRKAVVLCNVSGRDLGSVVTDIRQAVSSRVKLPTGYRVEYGGQIESAEEAARTLLILSIAALAGVVVLLVVALGSVRDALLVLINLPLALVGGVIGVYASGGVLSVASLVGFITLFGIATRNGLMLVAHVQHLVRVEGIIDRAHAVKLAASERLVPILMTALAAGLALVPLALGGGKPGSEIQTPMAIVILFGLLSSTALNMLVLPALYLRFGTHGRYQSV
jgi:Cu/Ag efflux pump CusA